MINLHSIHHGQTNLDPAARDRSRRGSLPRTGGDPRPDPFAWQPVPAPRPARRRQEPGGARHRPRRRHGRQFPRLACAAAASGALSRPLHGAGRDEAPAGAVRPAAAVAAVLAVGARHGRGARPHRAREPGPADGGLATAGTGGVRRPRQPCRSARRGRSLERAATLPAAAAPTGTGRAAGARRQSRGPAARRRLAGGRARRRAGASS